MSLADKKEKVLARARQLRAGRTARQLQNDLLDYVFDLGAIGDDEADHVVEWAIDEINRTPAAVPVATARAGAPAGPQRPQSPRHFATRGVPPPELLSAPYRFVDFEKAIVEADPQAKKAGFDTPLRDGFCGTVKLTLAVETPMLIGEEKTGTNPAITGPLMLGDKYVIPGATLRGLLRSTVEIIAASRLAQSDRHHRFGVRDFTHPLFADDARPQWDKLGSGWLRCNKTGDGPDDLEFFVDECDKRLVRIRALPRRLNAGQPTATGNFHLNWLQKKLEQKYQAAGYLKDDRIDFSERNAALFSADPAGEGYVAEAKSGTFKAHYVFAGTSPTLRDVSPGSLDQQELLPRKGNQKKVEYVFACTPSKTVELDPQVWKTFRLIHSKPSKHGQKADGSWAVLEKTVMEGGRIPVFFIRADDAKDNNIKDIGLTRLFKRGHRRDVAHALKQAGQPRQAKKDHLDITETLFGHVYEMNEWAEASVKEPSLAHKSRVSFGFAALQNAGRVDAAPTETVMMAPRGSFAPFYLAGQIKDWSSEDSRAAGRKRYFPRFGQLQLQDAGAAITRRLSEWQGNGKSDTMSQLKFLGPERGGELLFEASIHLHNVTAEEIGALLFALTHGGDPAKPCRHMIGRAKNAGAGQTRVKALDIQLERNDGTKDLLLTPKPWEQQGEGWLTEGSTSMEPFLLKFREHMQKTLPLWPNTESIQEFLGASTPGLVQAGPSIPADTTDYLPLKQHQQLRKYCKLDTSQADPPPAPATQPRYLAAPKTIKPQFPWMKA